MALVRIFTLGLMIVVMGGAALAGTLSEELALQLNKGAGNAATESEAQSISALEPFYSDRAMARSL